MTRDAITWFEIPARDLDRAQRFYETVLAKTLRRQAKALVASLRLAQPRLDAALAASAEDALSKILAALHGAIDGKYKVRVTYRDLKDTTSTRTPRALGCFCWDSVWTLAAWCELRHDFRSFRIDRMEAMDLLDERFRDEPGRTLADLLRTVR